MSEADLVAHLTVASLSKSFGDRTVLSELSFQLDGGDILGLVGPRGSGKTTCLRLLATVISDCEGEVQLNGVSFDKTKDFRQLIGYMPDFLGQYQDFTVRECLEFFARAYLVSPKDRPEAMRSALNAAQLQEHEDEFLADLSTEQERRLGLARLLMHAPALLLLDEPLAGLEPEAVGRIQEWLQSLQNAGTILIMSAQETDDVHPLANKIAFLDEGRLVALGPTEEVLASLDTTPNHHATGATDIEE